MIPERGLSRFDPGQEARTIVADYEIAEQAEQPGETNRSFRHGEGSGAITLGSNG
jgi:hypothetical protein